MDLLQRAAEMIDRAQDRMAQAGNDAARLVMSAAQIKALEVRQADLREQLERATSDLGRVAFQRWKCGGIGNDAELVAACCRVDQINAAYQQVLQDLISARAAVLGSDGAPGPPPSPPQYPNPSILAPPFPPDPLHPVGPMPPFGMGPMAGQPLPPPRLPRPASECPECYTVVPGDVDYCPSCGMRV